MAVRKRASYGSTREAVAWLLSCEHGPVPADHPLASVSEWRQPSRRSLEDLCDLMIIVYGPDVGLRRSDASVRSDLLQYATERIRIDTLPVRARRILRRLRLALVARGMLAPRPPPPPVESVTSAVQILSPGLPAREVELRTLRLVP